MKLETTVNTIERSQDFKKYDLQIQRENFAHIFSILTTKLYSNKIKAMIAETLANAYDSHVSAGKLDVPFEIHLPTSFSPVFKVIDYGIGMSDDDVKNIYSSFGFSTKRDDNNLAGMLGIGRLSILGVSNTFILICKKNGIQNSYSIFLNEIGLPEFTLLDTKQTTDSNGITIEVPIKSSDFYELKMQLREILRFYKLKPIIKGEANFEIPKTDYWFQDANWGITGLGHSFIIMGNYSYPIDGNSLKNPSTKISSLINAGVHLEVNIGDVSITPNRESLQYNDKTINLIKEKLEKIATELTQKIQVKFDQCKYFYEAYYLYKEYFKEYGGSQYIKDIVSSNIEWKGIKLKDYDCSFFNKFKPDEIECFYCYENNDITKKINQNNISLKKDVSFVENDLDLVKGISARLQNHFQAGKTGVHLLKFKSPVEKARFIKEMHLEGLEITPISTLQPIKNTNINPASEKAQAKILIYDKSVGSSRYDKSSNWKAVKKDMKEGGFFVPINRYWVTYNAARHSVSYINGLIEHLKEIGINFIEPVYGIKISSLEKIQKNKKWIDLKEFLRDSLKKYIETNKLESQLGNFNAALKISGLLNTFYSHSNKFTPTGKIYKFLEIIKTIKSNQSTLIKVNNIISAYSFSFDFKSTYNLMDMQREIYEKYPMLNCVALGYNSSEIKIVSDYCNSLDKL